MKKTISVIIAIFCSITYASESSTDNVTLFKESNTSSVHYCEAMLSQKDKSVTESGVKINESNCFTTDTQPIVTAVINEILLSSSEIIVNSKIRQVSK